MTWNTNEIVEQLRAARAKSGRVEVMNSRPIPLPSPAQVRDAVDNLKLALFPRHAAGRVLDPDSMTHLVGNALNLALHLLEEQVNHELGVSNYPPADPSKVASRGTEIVSEFARQLPGIYEVLETDIQSAYTGDPSATSTEEVLLSFPGVKAIFHHRIAHALYTLGSPIIARIVAELSHSLTGIDIHPGARIGKGFFVDHGTGVVIGETTIIGDRVRLYQGITLGAKRFKSDDRGALVKGEARHPIIEDDVVIYAGATILGRVVIGRGSTIGGNVWLTHSVPPNSHIMQAHPRSERIENSGGA